MDLTSLNRAYNLIEQVKRAVNALDKECVLDKPFFYARYELSGIISIFEKDRNSNEDTGLGQSKIKEHPQQEAVKILAYALNASAIA